jgi:PKD repeat protein
MQKNFKYLLLAYLPAIFIFNAVGCGSDELAETQNLPAKAVITGGDRQAINNTSVSFDGSTSYDRDGIIINYAWDFGEGTKLDSAGNTVAHIYNQPGTYHVVLTVMDDGGATDSTAITLEVLAAGANMTPTAKIWGSAENILPPVVINSADEVTFTGMGTDIDGSITGWSWNFGDGSSEDTGEVQTDGRSNIVKHTFINQSGGQRTYSVTLTVTDNLNAIGSTRQEIVVNAEPGSQNVEDYSGLWYWQLKEGEPVDPSGLGLCAFQDSQLNIQADSNAGTIIIEELLNNQAQATYSGSLFETIFQTTDSTGMQTINGDFTSTTTFTGTYTISTMGLFTECEIARAVEGIKQ